MISFVQFSVAIKNRIAYDHIKPLTYNFICAYMELYTGYPHITI